MLALTVCHWSIPSLASAQWPAIRWGKIYEELRPAKGSNALWSKSYLVGGFNPLKIVKIKTHFHINHVPTRAYARICDMCHTNHYNDILKPLCNQPTCCTQVYGLRSSGKTYSHKPEAKHFKTSFHIPSAESHFLHGSRNGGEDRRWQTDQQKLKIRDMMTWCDSKLVNFGHRPAGQVENTNCNSRVVVLLVFSWPTWETSHVLICA